VPCAALLPAQAVALRKGSLSAGYSLLLKSGPHWLELSPAALPLHIYSAGSHSGGGSSLGVGAGGPGGGVNQAPPVQVLLPVYGNSCLVALVLHRRSTVVGRCVFRLYGLLPLLLRGFDKTLTLYRWGVPPAAAGSASRTTATVCADAWPRRGTPARPHWLRAAPLPAPGCPHAATPHRTAPHRTQRQAGRGRGARHRWQRHARAHGGAAARLWAAARVCAAGHLLPGHAPLAQHAHLGRAGHHGP
jgi:hypothetical protein